MEVNAEMRMEMRIMCAGQAGWPEIGPAGRARSYLQHPPALSLARALNAFLYSRHTPLIPPNVCAHAGNICAPQTSAQRTGRPARRARACLHACVQAQVAWCRTGLEIAIGAAEHVGGAIRLLCALHLVEGTCAQIGAGRRGHPSRATNTPG